MSFVYECVGVMERLAFSVKGKWVDGRMRGRVDEEMWNDPKNLDTFLLAD